MALSADPNETLDKIKAAMKEGARLDLVRLLFHPTQKWGVKVYERGQTRGGNDKWVMVITIIPNDSETLADTLKMLADFADEGD